MLVRDLIAGIKRRETPTARFLYDVGKKAMRAEVPAPRAVYGPLWTLHHLYDETSRQLRQRLYYQPMFRARCESCGPGLIIGNGLPFVVGPLRITVGDSCSFEGGTTLAGGKVFDAPALKIGDHSYVGYGVTFSVSKAVTVGNHVKIAGGCFIADNPGHPMDAMKRRVQGVDKEDVQPVVIEDDVWLGTRVVVMPGVRIGRGTVVGIGSVVTKDLPANSLAVGTPARVVRSLDTEEDRAEARSSTLRSVTSDVAAP